ERARQAVSNGVGRVAGVGGHRARCSQTRGTETEGQTCTTSTVLARGRRFLVKRARRAPYWRQAGDSWSNVHDEHRIGARPAIHGQTCTASTLERPASVFAVKRALPARASHV